ncbi:MAG TPA: VOC family protein [Pseudobdellovibrionaceae bacterium]|nr:VOC family protein [Pseudobdellovibrionaceae bacterium]
MPDGRAAHWEMRVGDSVVMMGDAGDGSSVPCHIHVYVEDVDKAFKKAVKAGGEVVQEPMQKEDADRRGGIEDPAGAAVWWISTQVGRPRKSS